MNTPIVCQVFSSYTEDHPKLFHNVEKLVTNGKFEHAAVYEIIDDPQYAGSYPLDTSNDSYSFLTILRSNLSYRIGGEDQRVHSPSLTWTYEGAWRQFGPYHADDLSTISNEACSEPNGPSVDCASYMLHIEIPSGPAASPAFDILRIKTAQGVPGWKYTSTLVTTRSLRRTSEDLRSVRFVCIMGFGANVTRRELQELVSHIAHGADNAQEIVCLRMRICKLYGSMRTHKLDAMMLDYEGAMKRKAIEDRVQ